MKIEIEIEEREGENEDAEYEEYVSILTFDDCSRNDLEELGKFFLKASKELLPKRIGPREIRVSQMYLGDVSEHFKDHETLICVSLDIDEP